MLTHKAFQIKFICVIVKRRASSDPSHWYEEENRQNRVVPDCIHQSDIARMDDFATVVTKSDIQPYMLEGLTSKSTRFSGIAILPNPTGNRNRRRSTNWIAIYTETKTAKKTVFLKLLEEMHNSLVALELVYDKIQVPGKILFV